MCHYVVKLSRPCKVVNVTALPPLFAMYQGLPTKTLEQKWMAHTTYSSFKTPVIDS